MTTYCSLLTGLITGGFVLLMGGCSSTQDSFFLLTADGRPASAGTAGGKVVGLGPVDLPDYIDRAELVFQSDTNRFQVPPDQRWAGDLRENVTDVLAINLGRRLKGTTVHAHPWNEEIALRFSIPVTIRQFHAVSGGDAILDVRWEILEGASGKVLGRGSEVFAEGLSEEGYDGVVAAESRLLAQLADALAAAVAKAGL
jgi:uncharacterized lipoprotein YmbA